MKRLRILRGLPGSGKTTLAKKLGQEGAMVFSTDDLLSEGGVFRWTEDGSIEAHHKNQQRVSWAMRQGYSDLVVDNTNIFPYMAAPFVRLANYYKYDWSIEETSTPWATDIDELTLKNTHDVPRSVIEVMHKSYMYITTPSMIVTLGFEISMDPEATLREAQQALELGQKFRADEQIIDYRDWRTIGGYEPIGGDDTANNISDKLNSWRARAWAMGF